jgi:adenylate cyclase
MNEQPPVIPLRSARRTLWIIFGMILVPNLIGSVVNIWYNHIHVDSLLASAEQQEKFAHTWVIYNSVVYPIALGVWALAVVSLRKPLNCLLRDQPVEPERMERARRRVINLPWWGAGAGAAAAGWFLCIPAFWIGMSLGPVLPPAELYWHLLISFLVAGLIAISQSFFAIEMLGQRMLYPIFFQDARPADTPGAIIFTLRRRGVVWAVTVGMCPIASVVLVTLAPGEATGSQRAFVVAVGAIGIVFGLITSWLIGRSVAEPVNMLRDAAQQVRAGRLDVKVPLLRADEFGTLIDEFNHMVGELREKAKLRETFGLHVGEHAAKQILARDPGLGGIEEEITVMFMDIRNFTARSAVSSAQEIVSMLNIFLTDMVQIVEEHHGGLVNKYLGDGFMALFGAGGGPSNHAASATAAGREMLVRLVDLNERLSSDGTEPLGIGIGIHTGLAVVGSIGSPRRLEFTAIGDTVNLASRVEGLTKVVGCPLLVTAATRAAFGEAFETKEFPPQKVKGQPKPVVVCGVEG